MERGFIKGKRAPFCYGKNQVWSFQEKDILEFVRNYPYFLKEKRMEPGPWRQIVRDEYARDPWYDSTQATKFLGVIDHNAVHRYIRRGWLKAVKRPVNIDGQWIIRKSAIDAFLANDKRREHHSRTMVESRRRKQYKNGVPIAVFKQWIMKCSYCNHKVKIISDPNMTSLEVKAAFMTKYVDEAGVCWHGRKCEVKEERKIDNQSTTN